MLKFMIVLIYFGSVSPLVIYVTDKLECYIYQVIMGYIQIIILEK